MNMLTMDGLSSETFGNGGQIQALIDSVDVDAIDFSTLDRKISSAIDGMVPAHAMNELMSSPSNDHCYQTSCGLSSFIEP